MDLVACFDCGVSMFRCMYVVWIKMQDLCVRLDVFGAVCVLFIFFYSKRNVRWWDRKKAVTVAVVDTGTKVRA